MFAIACGYEDADDCDALRADPLFKLTVGRAPVSGRDLCSQPTMSRLENAPSRIEVARMREIGTSGLTRGRWSAYLGHWPIQRRGRMPL